VHPISEAGATSANVYFPGQDVFWYEIETYSVYRGPGYQTIPVVVDKVSFIFTEIIFKNE